MRKVDGEALGISAPRGRGDFSPEGSGCDWKVGGRVGFMGKEVKGLKVGG
ncbi:hypothetical protein SAMN05421761_12013 [Belliella pelovolcani]|uniref:Uncharacterized protein n=1 Tax=Belliella pelovolcani TaxID=529505 RepID=A0A1N7PSF5_9BACT|nr:hypothetical protein SAMN05421761_12013 [Belliella pelovolcani]